MPPQGEKRPQRIHILIAALMVGLAFLFDVLQFLSTFLNIIPGVGVVVSEYISFVSVIVFGLWFAFQKVSYFDRNGAVKLIIGIASTVVELVPFVDALPAITLGVLSLILVVRAEDSGIDLNAVRKARRGAMTPEKRAEGDMWTKKRMDLDQKSNPSRRYLGQTNESYENRQVDRERSKKNMVGYSSPTLRNFEKDTMDQSGNGEDVAQ